MSSHLRASSPDLSVGTRIDRDDVAKRYVVGGTTVTALAEVNLHVDEGAFIVVLGPSGSGKTTLLNLVGALDAASEGRVVIAGHDVTAASRSQLFRLRRETVSFIFQSFNLFPTLTALENVRIALDVRGQKGFAAANRAEEVLRDVGLAYRLRSYPGNLSGGEQQRVAVARAIASSPSIVLADEPTAALDGENGHAVMALLARIAKEQHRSVLAVTHDPRTLSYADRVVRIEDGRIVGEERRPEGLDAPEIADLTKRRKAHA
jgi:putative ABC transport system ATP-binding protein